MTFPAIVDQGVERLGGSLQGRGDLLRRSPRLLQGRQGGSIFFCNVRPDPRLPLCHMPSTQCTVASMTCTIAELTESRIGTAGGVRK